MAKQPIRKKTPRIKKVHSLLWVFDPLEGRGEFIVKKMFGCLAGYLGDRLVLVLADKAEPWNGILIPTEKDFHLSLMKKFPAVLPHPVLGKWLYLSQSSEGFEELASEVVERILSGDPLIGVNPKVKSPKK